MNSNMVSNMDGMFEFEEEMSNYHHNEYADGNFNVATNHDFGDDLFSNNSYIDPSTLNHSSNVHSDSVADFRRVMNEDTPRMDDGQYSANVRRIYNEGTEYPFPDSRAINNTASTAPSHNLTSSNIMVSNNTYNVFNEDDLPDLNEMLNGLPERNEMTAVNYASTALPRLPENRESNYSKETPARTLRKSPTLAVETAAAAKSRGEPEKAEEPKPKRKRGARKKIRSVEEQERKREMHLKRNREAAQKCRAKKKGWEERMKGDLEIQRLENQKLWALSEELKEQCHEMDTLVMGMGHCVHAEFRDKLLHQWNIVQKRKQEVEAALADLRDYRAEYPEAETPDSSQKDEDEEEQEARTRVSSQHSMRSRSMSRQSSGSLGQNGPYQQALGMHLPPTAEQQALYMQMAARQTEDMSLSGANGGTSMSRGVSSDSAVADLSKSSRSPDSKDGNGTPVKTENDCLMTTEDELGQQRLPNQRLVLTAYDLTRTELPDAATLMKGFSDSKAHPKRKKRNREYGLAVP